MQGYTSATLWQTCDMLVLYDEGDLLMELLVYTSIKLYWNESVTSQASLFLFYLNSQISLYS